MLALPCPRSTSPVLLPMAMNLDHHFYIFLTSISFVCPPDEGLSSTQAAPWAFQAEQGQRLQPASLKGGPSPIPHPHTPLTAPSLYEFTKIDPFCSTINTEGGFCGWVGETTEGDVSPPGRRMVSGHCTNSASLRPLNPFLQITTHGPMSFALVTGRTRYWQPVGIFSCLICSVAFKYASSSHKHESWQ